MTPPAPGRGSITTCWPSASDILGAEHPRDDVGTGPDHDADHAGSDSPVPTGEPHVSARSARTTPANRSIMRCLLRCARTLFPSAPASGRCTKKLAAAGRDIKRIKLRPAETAFVGQVRRDRMAFDHRAARRKDREPAAQVRCAASRRPRRCCLRRRDTCPRCRDDARGDPTPNVCSTIG